MKILIYLIAIAMVAFLIVFDMKNLHVNVGYFCVTSQYYTTSVAMMVTAAFLGGLIFGILYNLARFIDNKKTSSAQSRRVEKMSVDKDTAEMKIQTLEAKVKTLESALEKALTDKN